MTGWRCATADPPPADGTPFQAWLRDSWEPRVRLNAKTGALEIWEAGDYDGHQAWRRYTGAQPLRHWMPTPAAPEPPR